MRRKSHFINWIAVIVLLAALGIWGDRLWQHAASKRPSLTDTTGVEVAVLKVSTVTRGYRVMCRMENRSIRVAEQVVFQVAVLNAAGESLAVNPLASASALVPGEMREIPVIVPAPTAFTHVNVKAHITLVRWAQ